MQIGNRSFDTKHHTYIMGILNVTPDSFSDGGKHQTIDASLRHAERMIREGADILDIGGESTRPGYKQISDDEETARILPVIEAVLSRFDIPVSVDTYKAKVAETALQAGVHLVNDIWGLKYDEDAGQQASMATVIAKYDAACCLMHNDRTGSYTDFLPEVINSLQESLNIAKKAGIDQTKIILDPGVGFAKNYEQNLEIINRLEELHMLGYPILLGASRKSVIGNALDLPVTERVEGTLVTSVYAVQKKCSFVRVHDVKENARAIKMVQALMNQ